MSLTAAVLTFNGDHLLPDCLESVWKQLYVSEFLLVDNGSTNPVLSQNYPGWKLHRENYNRGNIGGQNACFEAASSEWVLFVANDVRLLPRCAEKMLAVARLMDKPGQIQPELYTDKGDIDQIGMDWIWPGYGISRKRVICRWPWIVPSTCYLMRKSVWKEIGGFDESLVSSHEDVDMGIRLSKAGYTNGLAPSAIAVHLVNQTLKYTIKDPKRTFYEARCKVIRKHYKGFDKLIRLSAVKTLYQIPTQTSKIVSWARRS